VLHQAISKVLGTFQVFDDTAVSRKNIRPPALSAGKYFGCLQVFEILVVSQDYDLVIGTLKVMLPLF